jgi:hypothetical protein
MDVPTMWSTIESQETTPHWEMLTGWRRSFELILQHMAQVRNYRENLTSAWPPEKSQASAAYVVELDALLANLQQTYDAAVANHTAFSTATLSLSSARSELKQIYDAYTANQAKLDEFHAKPKPVQYGKAPVPPQKPPVTSAQQEELNFRARAVMSGLSTELIQARMSITTPATYSPSAQVWDERERNDPGQTAPAIPPVVPVFPSDEGNGRASSPSVSPSAHSAVDSPPSTRTPGLVLGGVQPGLVPPPTVSPFPTPSTPVAGGGPLPGVIAPAAGVPISPIGPPATPSAKPTAGQVLPRGGSVGSIPPGSGRPMTPGGVIGAMPGMVPNGSGAPASRVNPVGGVINSPGQPATRGKSGVGYPMSTMAGRPLSQDQADAPKRWDPDDLWYTAEGVPPVLAPAPEQRVDPGPAIGLV